MTGPTGNAWLESASDLLAEGDPGETPFLVDDLIVLGAIAALVGPYKVGKTWVVLELAISIAAGVPAFGHFEVAPGPVMLILEESGRSALHRRLIKLLRGRGMSPAQLSQLHFATNKGVNLSDREWQEAVLSEAKRISPALIVFDPLARVKGSADESSQSEIAPVLDFLRELREASGSAVLFVHHAGHQGERMRGSSDLEAYWESKLTIKAEKGRYSMRADHREAPSAEPLQYSLAIEGGSAMLEPREQGDQTERRGDIVAYVKRNPGVTRTEIRKDTKELPGRASDKASHVNALVADGTLHSRPSQRPDAMGRTTTVETLYVTANAGPSGVPPSGHSGTPDTQAPSDVPASRPFWGGRGTANLDGQGES